MHSIAVDEAPSRHVDDPHPGSAGQMCLNGDVGGAWHSELLPSSLSGAADRVAFAPIPDVSCQDSMLRMRQRLPYGRTRGQRVRVAALATPPDTEVRNGHFSVAAPTKDIKAPNLCWAAHSPHPTRQLAVMESALAVAEEVGIDHAMVARILRGRDDDDVCCRQYIGQIRNGGLPLQQLCRGQCLHEEHCSATSGRTAKYGSQKLPYSTPHTDVGGGSTTVSTCWAL